MSVLIKGIEMPENGWKHIMLTSDGKAYRFEEFTADKTATRYEAVEVPSHGRLIDADALMNDGWTLHKQVMHMGGYAIHEMPLDNPNVPIVIPADSVRK